MRLSKQQRDYFLNKLRDIYLEKCRELEVAFNFTNKEEFFSKALVLKTAKEIKITFSRGRWNQVRGTEVFSNYDKVHDDYDKLKTKEESRFYETPNKVLLDKEYAKLQDEVMLRDKDLVEVLEQFKNFK